MKLHEPKDPERVWFSSDHHFGHKNIMRHCGRPFDTVKEMDEALLEDWRSTVGPKDWVIYLGDLTWGNPARIIPHLTGRIVYLYGNHDARVRQYIRKENPPQIHRAATLLDIKFSNIKFMGEPVRMAAFHYPIMSWNMKHYGALHVYGHCHGGMSHDRRLLIPGALDVGLDAHGLKMLNFVQVMEKIQGQCLDEKPMIFRPKAHMEERKKWRLSGNRLSPHEVVQALFPIQRLPETPLIIMSKDWDKKIIDDMIEKVDSDAENGGV